MAGVKIVNARAPEGLRIYAIGDIHGRADLLDRLARIIADDLARKPVGDSVTVFVGDYVDRGYESRAVIERLATSDFPTPIVTLRGNHEDTMLRFLDDPAALGQWVMFGGQMTLDSYGVEVGREMWKGGAPLVQATFLESFPAAHRRFLEETLFFVEYGDYYFCHAGVRPHVPLEQQDPSDLMWIRHEFLQFKGGFGKVVVHGHTPHATVESLENRINVDTHAYRSGVLTAAVLEGVERRFLDTR
jgi:serine/threonine protein phosphatase 1